MLMSPGRLWSENIMSAVYSKHTAPVPRRNSELTRQQATSAECREDVVLRLYGDADLEEDLRNWLNGGHHELIVTSRGIPIVAMRRCFRPRR